MEKFGFIWPEFVTSVEQEIIREEDRRTLPRLEKVHSFLIVESKHVSDLEEYRWPIVAYDDMTYAVQYTGQLTGRYMRLTADDPVTLLKNYIAMELEELEIWRGRLKKKIDQCIRSDMERLGLSRQLP